MPLVLGGSSAVAGAYSIDNSCMFDKGDTAYLSITPAGDGNKKTFTISMWVKRAVLGYQNTTVNLMMGADSGSGELSFYEDDKMKFYIDGTYGQTTNALFRDPTAWYHIVQAVDTSQSVATDRIKTYVNGTQVTDFSSTNDPPLNQDSKFCSSSYAQTVSGASDSFGGYMADVCFIDGTQYDADDFGEFDADSPNTWIPKDVSGLTYGTNGFLLDFADSADFGNDVSGNGNDLTNTDLTATDQMTDTPTNNYPTLNPLYKNQFTYSEGNLNCTITASAFEAGVATFGATKGKWYCEFKCTATASSGLTRNSLGIVAALDCQNEHAMGSGEIGYSPLSIGWAGTSGTGAVHKDSSAQSGTFAVYGVGDICGVAMDLDNAKLYFSKNGTYVNSGDPESGATGTGAIDIDSTTSGYVYLFANTNYANSAYAANFGNPSYANTSDAADANGYGRFEYAPPANYYTLNTKNLAEYG